jgi:hypothetical protein
MNGEYTETMHTDGRRTFIKYRNRFITVHGPATAARLLLEIGDAVRFEGCRNMLLADMLSDPANEGIFTRYTAPPVRYDCPVLEPSPLPDPSAGLNTEEVAALLKGRTPVDGGATAFLGLRELGLGQFVCRWSGPYC